MTNIKELINPFKELNDTLKCVGKLAKELKLECYVVGGAVRDLFLQRKISEIDIMVVGDGIRFAKELADHIYFTDNGVIVEHGPPNEFFNEAKDPRTKEFLSQIL